MVLAADAIIVLLNCWIFSSLSTTKPRKRCQKAISKNLRVRYKITNGDLAIIRGAILSSAIIALPLTRSSARGRNLNWSRGQFECVPELTAHLKWDVDPTLDSLTVSVRCPQRKTQTSQSAPHKWTQESQNRAQVVLNRAARFRTLPVSN
jgi:hypothetical protein